MINCRQAEQWGVTMKPKHRKEAKASINKYVEAIDMIGLYRKTTEGDVHWKSLGKSNSPRLHIRAREVNGSLKWFAVLQLFDELEDVAFEQDNETGHPTMESALNSVRNRLAKLASTLTSASYRF